MFLTLIANELFRKHIALDSEMKSGLTKRAPDGAIALRFTAQFVKFGAIISASLARPPRR
jgi:hypothetical protein